MVAPIYNYTLEILQEPMAVIANLPKEIRRQIGHKLDLMQRDFTGDIKNFGVGRTNIVCELGRIEFSLG